MLAGKDFAKPFCATLGNEISTFSIANTVQLDIVSKVTEPNKKFISSVYPKTSTKMLKCCLPYNTMY